MAEILAFQLSTDLEQLPQEIGFNYEELKSMLPDMLSKYTSLVVTEDSIKSAEKDRANLNKLKKAIDDERKRIKAQYLAPYNAMEAKCKEIMEMIDAPVVAIDTQIKAFEKAAIDQKYAELFTWFARENVLDFVSIKQILNPKWQNKGEKTEKLIAEMQEQLDCIKAEYHQISEMYNGSSILPAILDKYKTSLDKASTLAYAVQLEKQIQAEEQRKLEEEKARLHEQLEKAKEQAAAAQEAKEAAQRAREEQRAVLRQECAEAVTEPTEAVKEPMLTGCFRVWGTKSDIIKLRDFMKQNGIMFESVRV